MEGYRPVCIGISSTKAGNHYQIFGYWTIILIWNILTNYCFGYSEKESIANNTFTKSEKWGMINPGWSSNNEFV